MKMKFILEYAKFAGEDAEGSIVFDLSPSGSKTHDNSDDGEVLKSAYNANIYVKGTTLKDFIIKIAKELGYTGDGIKILGHGGFGTAFQVSDKHVLKITTDDDEAYLANRLRRSRTKYIISYYDVRELKSDYIDDDVAHYTLIMDKLEKLSKLEKSIFDTGISMLSSGSAYTKNIMDDLLNDPTVFHNAVEDEEDYVYNYREDYSNDQMLEISTEIYENFNELIKEANRLNIVYLDIKAANVGWKNFDDGTRRLIMYDVGVSESRGKDLDLKPLVI